MYVGPHHKRSYDKPNVSFEADSTDSTGVERDPTHVNIGFEEYAKSGLQSRH